MKLDDFRWKKGWSYSELGRRLGIKRPANARRYCLAAAHAEFRMPDDPTMRKIVALSDGQVTPNDFYELPTAGRRPHFAHFEATDVGIRAIAKQAAKGRSAA